MTNLKKNISVSQKKKEQVINELIKFILKNKYKIGQRILPERKLAEALNSSRSTIREVIGILVERDILKVKRGSGIYLVEAPSVIINHGDRIYSTENMIKDQLEAIFSFYPVVTGYAAIRATENEVNEIKDCIIKISKAFFAKDLKNIIESDKEFYRILSRMTKNKKFIEVMKILNNKNHIIWENSIQDDGFINNDFFAGYVGLVSAITAGDSTKAIQQCMQNIKNICHWFEKHKKIYFKHLIKININLPE